jgi:hypothetical protein
VLVVVDDRRRVADVLDPVRAKGPAVDPPTRLADDLPHPLGGGADGDRPLDPVGADGLVRYNIHATR